MVIMTVMVMAMTAMMMMVMMTMMILMMMIWRMPRRWLGWPQGLLALTFLAYKYKWPPQM